jgi:iron-sulfur cluster insertion protein
MNLRKREVMIDEAVGSPTSGVTPPRALYCSTEMITITEKAAAKVHEIAAAESLEGQGLRLRVMGGGCAGFTYDLYFEDKIGELDEQFESNGVKLYVDPLSFQYLDSTEIDFVEGEHGSGFKFNNPNVKGSCGCGSSFSA